MRLLTGTYKKEKLYSLVKIYKRTKFLSKSAEHEIG